jgi:2-polyprenyl-3-methyl-5-hydroxy-6-metoxy-1,4-benzoquinol methylase
MKNSDSKKCNICDFEGHIDESKMVPCNVRKFRKLEFLVWRCPHCRSLHGPEINNLDSFYLDYPIRNQKLDYFLKSWFRNILKVLKLLGLTAEKTLLDYGCNQGLWLDFLSRKGMSRVYGYDSYVERFDWESISNRKYDFVYSADVIEHDSNPKEFLLKLKSLMAPGAKLVLLTPNAEGIDLNRIDDFLHVLHMPYHQHILSRAGLLRLATQLGLKEIFFCNRWYMDSFWPATSRRFIELYMSKAGNDLDSGYEPPRLKLFLKHPILIFYLFFGYFLPSKKKDSMMLVFSAIEEPNPIPESARRFHIEAQTEKIAANPSARNMSSQDSTEK